MMVGDFMTGERKITLRPTTSYDLRFKGETWKIQLASRQEEENNFFEFHLINRHTLTPPERSLQ
jgi:hypothetical protein